MRNSKILNCSSILILSIVWAVFLIYFYLLDIESFILCLVIPPSFGILLALALRTHSLVLGFFFSIAFIATAFTPSFLFLNKEDYDYAGFNAIRNFDFSLYSFMVAYCYLYIFLLETLLLSIGLRCLKMKFKFSHFNFSVGTINFCIGSKLAIKIHALSEGKKSTFSFCCAILIFFALIPLNIFMYRNGVGIAIVEPGSLPFKLVGITFYIRNYIAPLLLTYLYAKSDRNYILTIVIFVYAIIVGIVSLSKGNIVLTCIPVLLFAFIDKKPYKFVAALIFSMFLYGGVAWARQYVFLADVGSFDMIQMILTNSFSEDFWFHVNPIRVFSEFSNRLFGANVIVLANQYYLDEVGNHIFNFFWGNPDELNEIITFDVFGLQRVNGLVIGVSMGYIGTMLLLSQGNILLISVLSLITAIYLTICSCIVERYLKDDSFFSVLGYAFCFFFVFFLYEVHMTRFYFVVILSLFILFIIKHIKFKVNTPLISCNTHKQRQS